MTKLVEKKILCCSFCSKTQNDVEKLIAGNDVYICNECVDLCHDIVNNTSEKKDNSLIESISLPKPAGIKKQLDEYIIGQEQAKLVLSVVVYNHYKRILSKNANLGNDLDDVQVSKSNVLVVGPTGSGKTLIAQILAKILNVPFAISDATALTEAGYVGEDVENIILRLVQSADYNIQKAQMGIIYIDEVDKISRKSDSPSLTRDVSGEGVQQALLKIIEGTTAMVPPQGGRKHPGQELIKVDTSNILFICGGTFAGIESIVNQRKEKGGMGFITDLKNKEGKVFDRANDIEMQDLVKYGLIPEFIGRLPVIVSMEDLSEAQLSSILVEPKNAIVKQYRKLFAMDDIELVFTDCALSKVSQLARQREIGARGLRTILETILLKITYDVTTLTGVEKIVIDSSVINGTSDAVITMKDDTTTNRKTDSYDIEKKKIFSS